VFYRKTTKKVKKQSFSRGRRSKLHYDEIKKYTIYLRICFSTKCNVTIIKKKKNHRQLTLIAVKLQHRSSMNFQHLIF
jgi:hypothetical protein